MKKFYNPVIFMLSLLLSYYLGFKWRLILQQTGGLNGKDWTIIIISSVVGGLIAFGLVVLVQWLQRPNLVFSRGTENFDIKNDPPDYKILHIKIKNLSRRSFLSPIDTLASFSTRAKIILEDSSESKSYSGKWASTPEPLTTVALFIPPGTISVKQITDSSKALVPPREDILSSDDDDDAVMLAIAIKFEGEDEFYGFNNESYLGSGLKYNNLKFSGERYKGKVIISAAGVNKTQRFELLNPTNSMEDFHLAMED